MEKGIIVHALIHNEKGELLLLRRSLQDSVLPGQWDIPGGTLEDGEDPAFGAQRETLEEAGLHIAELQLFCYHTNVDQKKNKQFITLIFLGQFSGGVVHLNTEDHSDYRWVLPKDVKDMHLVHYLPECLHVIQKRHLL